MAAKARPANASIDPDRFLRGCTVALIVATATSAAVARWWPFGDGFPAFVGGALAGVAVAFLFIPWRWVDALRKHIRSMTRLAEHARDMADPLVEAPRSPGRISNAEMQCMADALQAMAGQRRALEADLRQARRSRESAIEQETRRATVDLRRQASTDMLTGLENRRSIEPWVEALDQGGNRRRQVTVVAIDMDHFKPINDTLGHEVGDDCLRFLGQLLRSHVRGDDCAIRLGGDEFLLLLRGGHEDAQSLCDRLRDLFAQMPWPHTRVDRPNLSMGIASDLVHDMHDMHALMRTADSALYRAKHSGRGRTVVAPVAARAVA